MHIPLQELIERYAINAIRLRITDKAPYACKYHILTRLRAAFDDVVGRTFGEQALFKVHGWISGKNYDLRHDPLALHCTEKMGT
jgi:hypothetical protein